MLQDMRDAKIIAYKKTKVQTAIVTGNYLLAIAGKASARVILPQLQKLAERIYPES